MKKIILFFVLFILFSCKLVFPRYEVTDLTVVGLDQAVLLSWVTPDINDEKYAKYYSRTELYWGTSEGQLERYDGELNPSHTLIKDLKNNISYIFKLYIVDINETFSKGVKQWGTPINILPPSSCSNLLAHAGNGAVRLTWNHPTVGEYAGAQVWVTNEDGIRQKEFKVAKIGSGNFSQLEIDGLTNNKLYYFFVQSFDYSGNVSSLIMTKSVPDGTAPENPLLIMPKSDNDLKTVCSDRRIDFVFESPKDSDYFKTVVFFAKNGYVLEEQDVVIQKLAGGLESFYIDGLENGVSYQLTLIAYDSSSSNNSIGNASSGSVVTTDLIPYDEVAPQKISSVSYQRVDNSTFLTWLNPPDSDLKRIVLERYSSTVLNGDAREYSESDIASLSGVTWSVVDENVLDSSVGFTVRNTDVNSAYIFKWRVEDTSIEQSTSNFSIYYYFIPKIPPSEISVEPVEPILLTSYEEKNEAIEINYTLPNKTDNILVRYSNENNEDGATLITLENQNSIVINNLNNASKYYFFIRNRYNGKNSVPVVFTATPKIESSEIVPPITMSAGEGSNKIEVDFNMVYVRAGNFLQGDQNIVAVKDITITKDFLVSQTETSYNLWHIVYNWATGKNNYKFYSKGREGDNGIIGNIPVHKTEYYPVSRISWYDAVVWCNALTEFYNERLIEGKKLKCCYTINGEVVRDSRVIIDEVEQMENLDKIVFDYNANGFRLPTEAEWEYCARWTGKKDSSDKDIFLSGLYQSTSYESYQFYRSATKPTSTYPTFHDFCWFGPTSGNGIITADDEDYLYVDGNCSSTVQGVARKFSNELKLYDMSGNLSEWCWDWYKYFDYHEPPLKEIDPVGPKSGVFRIIRGGSAIDAVTILFTAKRDSNQPFKISNTIGFRFVRNVN